MTREKIIEFLEREFSMQDYLFPGFIEELEEDEDIDLSDMNIEKIESQFHEYIVNNEIDNGYNNDDD